MEDDDGLGIPEREWSDDDLKRWLSGYYGARWHIDRLSWTPKKRRILEPPRSALRRFVAQETGLTGEIWGKIGSDIEACFSDYFIASFNIEVFRLVEDLQIYYDVMSASEIEEAENLGNLAVQLLESLKSISRPTRRVLEARIWHPDYPCVSVTP